MLKTLSIIFPFAFVQLCFSQSPINRTLNNYENVTIDSSNHQVYYEQRLYRNPMVGILELKQVLSTNQVTDFVPLYQGVPIARYKLDSQLKTTTLSRKERADFAKSQPFNARRYKFDFRIQPDFKVNFGYREQVVQSKTNILLQSQLYLNRGLVLNWGILFPIVNDLDNQSLNIRPAPIFLNQFLALDQANYLSLSAGFFYNDSYGFNGQYRHMDLTKNWSFGFEAGLTGFYFFPNNGLYYQPLDELMLLTDVAYRIPSRDITLKLSGGQYLYEDRGVRLDFIRQFTNVEIGFFATATRNGSTGGFNFAVPIPPGRIVQGQRVRLRSTEEFRYEYNYTRGYRIAERYKAGNQLDALLRQYHQSYLQNQVRLVN
ncbi:YjbH domain-containing protein [Spirosoma foliorum]|nr:YjbH domain-containing protein [Spirosoma foliorum]